MICHSLLIYFNLMLVAANFIELAVSADPTTNSNIDLVTGLTTGELGNRSNMDLKSERNNNNGGEGPIDEVTGLVINELGDRSSMDLGPGTVKKAPVKLFPPIGAYDPNLWKNKPAVKESIPSESKSRFIYFSLLLQIK